MYFINSEVIQGKTMHQICQNIASIPFKTYAEQFELIDTRSVGLVVERDEASQKLIEELRFFGVGVLKIAEICMYDSKRGTG